MPETRHVGSHATWFEEPDTIVLRLTGDVSVEESEILAREHLDMAAGRETVFMLVDMNGFGNGTPAGRKVTAEALTRMSVGGIAVCQTRLAVRVMAKLVFAGTRLFRSDLQFPVEFFQHEPDARAWLAARRGAGSAAA